MQQNHRIISLVSLQNKTNKSGNSLYSHALPAQLVLDIEKWYDVSIDHQNYNISNPSNTTHCGKNSHMIVSSNKNNDNNKSLDQAQKLVKFIVNVRLQFCFPLCFCLSTNWKFLEISSICSSVTV